MTSNKNKQVELAASFIISLLFFSQNILANDLYFNEVSEEYGLSIEHHIDLPFTTASSEPRVVSGGVASGDLDGDQFIDLLMVRGTAASPVILHNQGNGKFSKRPLYKKSDYPQDIPSGPMMADIDGDGDLDILLGGVDGTPVRVFQNNGQLEFAEISEQTGLIIPGGINHSSLSLGDYDRDGDLDLFIGHWEMIHPVPNYFLWQNNGQGQFTDVSQQAGLTSFEKLLRYTFVSSFTDINNDHWPDLLLANDFGHSQVFINQKNGKFKNITTNIISDENGMGAVAADFDNDGDMDWFVASINDPNKVPEGHWGISGNRFYKNDGQGKFSDATDFAGVRKGGWGWAACAADFNNDGWLDLFQVNGMGIKGIKYYESAAEYFNDASVLFINNGLGKFSEQAKQRGINDRLFGRGVVCFDADRDGDIDIFVTNNNGRSLFYRNDLSAKNYLSISLTGTGKNTQAIGARIELEQAGIKQFREIQANSHYLSNDPAEVHFGLSAMNPVNQLIVYWPDGDVSSYKEVKTNQRLVLKHPKLL